MRAETPDHTEVRLIKGNARSSGRYQESLRKLGAWLDVTAAACVSAIELSNGFSLKYQRSDVDSVFIQRFFTLHELRSLRWGDLRLRSTRVRRIGHKLRGLGAESGGYQDLFRALGFELDEAKATSVQLEERESEDALVITYESTEASPEGGRLQRKLVLGTHERQVLRQRARARRQEQRPRVWRRLTHP